MWGWVGVLLCVMVLIVYMLLFAAELGMPPQRKIQIASLSLSSLPETQKGLEWYRTNRNRNMNRVLNNINALNFETWIVCAYRT